VTPCYAARVRQCSAVKLRIDDISADSKEISFSEPEKDINHILGKGPICEYRVEGPITVDLSYYRSGMDLFLSGDIRTRTEATCARCAEEFESQSTRPFRLVLSPKAAGYGAESGLRADDLEFSLYEGDEIDLSPLICEQILLALPTRPLCREDCKGICPMCGANRNRVHCDCRAETFDPRLEVLRSIKLQRS
jgi:uncharacterized protein